MMLFHRKLHGHYGIYPLNLQLEFVWFIKILDFSFTFFYLIWKIFILVLCEQLIDSSFKRLERNAHWILLHQYMSIKNHRVCVFNFPVVEIHLALTLLIMNLNMKNTNSV